MNKSSSQIEKSIYRLFEVTPVPMALSFPDGKLEYVNPALKTMLGYEGESIYAENVIITHSDDVKVNEKIRQGLKKDPFNPIQIEKRYTHRLGHTVYVQLNIVAQAGENGEIKRYISQLIDLTTIKKSDAAELLLNHLVNQSNDAIYVVAPKFGQILNCNDLGYQRLGYTKEELLNLTVDRLRPDFQQEGKWQEYINEVKKHGSLVFEASHTRKDGTTFPVETNVSYINYNKAQYLLAIVRDISRRKQKELAALALANLDPLTKLPNRSIIEQQLDNMVSKAQQNNTLIAFIYIDVDDFKSINDNYGHVIGDEVLKTTANRLKSCIRDTDIITRMGGDEFLILINGIESKSSIKPVVEKFVLEFASPFKIQTHLINVTISIGVSVYCDENTEFHTLIQLADEAMYQAKKQTGTSIYFI